MEPGTPVPLASSSTLVRSFEVQAGRADGDNVGTVYIGDVTVDKDSKQLFRLKPSGAGWWALIPLGVMVDLAAYFIDADTATDGVSIHYIPVDGPV